jgi:hypothetical protein
MAATPDIKRVGSGEAPVGAAGSAPPAAVAAEVDSATAVLHVARVPAAATLA